MHKKSIGLRHKTTPATVTLACALGALCATAGSAGFAASDARPPVVHPADWPSVRPAIPKDPRLEARIDALLAAMTLEQKVGQLIQADISTVTPDDLRHYPLGSILNGGNSSPDNDEFAPPSKWLALADRFYDASVSEGHGTQPIPSIWGTDAVHGHNNIVGATLFPHNIGLGATRDPQLIQHIGEITAREVRVTGLDWTFGPTLAVVRDDRWGRTYESYSEDPELVREYAAAMVIGLQGKPGTPQFLDAAHVIATPKHFLGDGGTGGRDQGDNTSSEAELRDVHGAGYPAAIEAGAQSVMASFSSWHGLKMHGNQALLTDVLKGRMNFDGLVVGDWNGHAQLPGCTKSNCAAAVNAGVDVLMAPDGWKDLYANTLAQARSGEISASRLDDAVRRILRVKLRAHVLEEGRPSSRPLAGHFELLGAPEHRAVARQAVRESLVLLKNRNHVLPLSPRLHVLVAGDGADNIGKQSGGWSITWQGTGVSNKDFPNGESIYSGIRKAVAAAGGSAELSPTGEFTKRPDVAIVVFGENPYAEFQGDIGSVEYSPGDKPDLKLLRRLHALGVPVVAIFLSGRPLWVNAEINASDAFVAAWLPGSEGGGVADVLFRQPAGAVHYDFHGKLSFSWPRTPQQTGVNRGQAGEEPLFPYGYGLRYRDDGNLHDLPEEVSSATSAMIDTRVFFAAGRPGSGWHWFVQEGAQTRELAGGVGSATGGQLTLTAVDKSAQEDARRLRWSGASAARAGLAASSTIDLQREANGQLALAFDYRVEQPVATDVDVRIDCGAACSAKVPISGELRSAEAGQWRHVKIPLLCFVKAGADMSRVTMPFSMEAAGPLTLSVANVRLETGNDNLMSCVH